MYQQSLGGVSFNDFPHSTYSNELLHFCLVGVCVPGVIQEMPEGPTMSIYMCVPNQTTKIHSNIIHISIGIALPIFICNSNLELLNTNESITLKRNKQTSHILTRLHTGQWRHDLVEQEFYRMVSTQWTFPPHIETVLT